MEKYVRVYTSKGINLLCERIGDHYEALVEGSAADIDKLIEALNAHS